MDEENNEQENIQPEVTPEVDSDAPLNVEPEAENVDSEPTEAEEEAVAPVSFEEIETPELEIGAETENVEGEEETPVTVQPVRFGSFDDTTHLQGDLNKNLDILMDIKLQLTVELGRTELPIRKVLELTRGSIIELEKVAGEPVELYANGKLVAHGEVVVIEDNFGLRITSITDPEDRLKGIGS